MKDWAWFGRLVNKRQYLGKIALGLDSREGRLAFHGWTNESNLRPEILAKAATGWPLGAIIFTDIAKDGMMSGMNVQATENLIDATDVPVIASGGISSIKDIQECMRIGCWGAIIGKAWYEGKIDLARACEIANGTSAY